jgi:hypothetical protein
MASGINSGVEASEVALHHEPNPALEVCAAYAQAVLYEMGCGAIADLRQRTRGSMQRLGAVLGNLESETEVTRNSAAHHVKEVSEMWPNGDSARQSARL